MKDEAKTAYQCQGPNGAHLTLSKAQLSRIAEKVSTENSFKPFHFTWALGAHQASFLMEPGSKKEKNGGEEMMAKNYKVEKYTHSQATTLHSWC